jgi:hypothetical protein
MPQQNAYDAADAICHCILTDARLPVERCTTPDTRNAVACIVSQCWNTFGMDTEATEECMAHVGMFAVPIVQLVRLNANGNDSIPAHVLVAVCDIIQLHHSENVKARRAAMQARMEELRKKSAKAS